MKVLVTGATGFIGKRLVKRLLQENCDVVCTGRSLEKLKDFSSKAKIIYNDITDRKTVFDLFKTERPDITFHCAASVENSSLDNLRHVNVEGTKNIFDACLEAGVKKVIYVSSIAVISGNPQAPLTDDLPYSATNHYGQSKLEAEELTLDYRKRGLKIAIIRPCMVYGEDEPHMLRLLVNLIRWRLLPILGDAKNRLHLAYVENVVDVMLLGLCNDKAFDGSYIVADNEALSVKNLFEYIAEIIGAKKPISIPQNLVPLFTSIPFIGKRFSFLLKDRFYSIKRIKEELEYRPKVSVYEGLKRAVLSYK